MEFRGVIYFEGTGEVSTLKQVVLVVLKKKKEERRRKK